MIRRWIAPLILAAVLLLPTAAGARDRDHDHDHDRDDRHHHWDRYYGGRIYDNDRWRYRYHTVPDYDYYYYDYPRYRRYDHYYRQPWWGGWHASIHFD